MGKPPHGDEQRHPCGRVTAGLSPQLAIPGQDLRPPAPYWRFGMSMAPWPVGGRHWRLATRAKLEQPRSALSHPGPAGFPGSRSRSQRIGGNDADEVAPGTAGHGPATRFIYVFFCRTGLGIRPGHVPADLRVRGGWMYREGWKQEEIRVAIDGPSGAHDDDPEQAGDSEPEKVHGHGRQQPAEMRSRAEYYEELRATDKQMAASDCRSDRPPLDSLHVTPERAGHILDGDRWGGGHRHGTGRPGKTEFPRQLGRREDHRARPERGPRSGRPARVPGQPQMAGARLS